MVLTSAIVGLAVDSPGASGRPDWWRHALPVVVMAAGGVACTGISGEDYAVPGRNALVLQTPDPREFVSLFARLRAHPGEERALRHAGRRTARTYAWAEVLRRQVLPRLDLLRAQTA